MVFDNLKFSDQMAKQLKDWGQYSDQIKDYTNRGLQAKLATKEGQELMHMVDPYSYRDRIKVPTLIVNGANDPYWTVNSTSVYWNDLRQAKYLLEVPNSGHGLEDKNRVVATVGAFARSLSGQFKMPKLDSTMSVDRDHNTVTFSLIDKSTKPNSVAIWKAESSTKDFRPSKWKEIRIGDDKDITTEFNPNVWTALFVEAKYSIGGKSFTLSTPVQVVGAQEP